MGDGAADGTSEGETGVKLEAAHLGGSRGGGLLSGDGSAGSGSGGRHDYRIWRGMLNPQQETGRDDDDDESGKRKMTEEGKRGFKRDGRQ